MVICLSTTINSTCQGNLANRAGLNINVEMKLFSLYLKIDGEIERNCRNILLRNNQTQLRKCNFRQVSLKSTCRTLDLCRVVYNEVIQCSGFTRCSLFCLALSLFSTCLQGFNCNRVRPFLKGRLGQTFLFKRKFVSLTSSLYPSLTCNWL